MKFLRALAILMVLLLLTGSAMAGSTLYSDVAFTMTLFDQTSGRATMTLTQQSTGSTDIVIMWGDSASVTYQWKFSVPAEENTSDEELVYSNCTCARLSYTEDGSEQIEILYENGTGKLVAADDGYAWQDDQENVGKDCLFVPDDSSVLVVSNYVDTISQRAIMTLTAPFSIEEQSQEATISWADSASVEYVWSMSFQSGGIYLLDEETESIPYSNGTCKRFVYAEDGSYSEELLYENGTGSFKLVPATGLDGEQTAGYLWQPESDSMVDNCLFVLNMVEGPEAAYAEDEMAVE